MKQIVDEVVVDCEAANFARVPVSANGRVAVEELRHDVHVNYEVVGGREDGKGGRCELAVLI
jgi:hypothetical protein